MNDKSNLDSIVKAYTRGKCHDEYSDPHASELANYEKILVQVHCPNFNIKILNIGCGTGRETFALYHMGYHNVKGLDCTPALLQIAQKRNRESGLNIDFKLGFAHDLPFTDSSFDLVTMFENIYGHITPHSTRLKSLAEVRRVLKPEGLVMPHVTSLYNVWRFFAYIKIQELIRLFYNPLELETGDKIMKIEYKRSKDKKKSKHRARSHWFRPNELPDDAQAIGLKVIHTTTSLAIIDDHKKNSTKCHNKDRLLYVLQLPL